MNKENNSMVQMTINEILLACYRKNVEKGTESKDIQGIGLDWF